MKALKISAIGLGAIVAIDPLAAFCRHSRRASCSDRSRPASRSATGYQLKVSGSATLTDVAVAEHRRATISACSICAATARKLA